MRTASVLKQKGFTMIELLVVLVILGLLAGLVGPKMFGKVDSAKTKTVETQMSIALKRIGEAVRFDIRKAVPAPQRGK